MYGADASKSFPKNFSECVRKFGNSSLENKFGSLACNLFSCKELRKRIEYSRGRENTRRSRVFPLHFVLALSASCVLYN